MSSEQKENVRPMDERPEEKRPLQEANMEEQQYLDQVCIFPVWKCGDMILLADTTDHGYWQSERRSYRHGYTVNLWHAKPLVIARWSLASVDDEGM